jgi:acyl-CoA dehydrogenase
MGGAGIMRGPANIIGNGYMNIPIANTVEGANILTRSLISFGQGLTRGSTFTLVFSDV